MNNASYTGATRCPDEEGGTEVRSPWNGQLFAKQIMPFVDMTVKGFTWYQGENNMDNVKGNAAVNVGYSCKQRELVKGWRAIWSETKGTTDPEAPCGGGNDVTFGPLLIPCAFSQLSDGLPASHTRHDPADIRPSCPSLIGRLLGAFWQSDRMACSHLQVWARHARVERDGGWPEHRGHALGADRGTRSAMTSISFLGPFYLFFGLRGVI